MIIYEVNLTINKDIFDNYKAWLIPHVKHMLTFPGFKQTTFFYEQLTSDENDSEKLTVQYEIDIMDNLTNYLENHAHHMREDGLKKFPKQFSATRRIFETGETLYSSI